MQSLQLIQHLDVASVVAFMLVLPWVAVASMHAVSSLQNINMNDAWNERADTLVRWARAAIVNPPGSTVLKFTARRAARQQAIASPALHAA